NVALKPVGDPVVDTNIPFDLLHDNIVNAIKTARDQALTGGATSVSDTVNDKCGGAKKKLIDGLKSFDDSGSASFTALELTSDGIIVREETGSSARQGAVVRIAETDEGRAFTALHSWIPGGRIERFIWTWVEYPGRISKIWSGVTKNLTDD